MRLTSRHGESFAWWSGARSCERIVANGCVGVHTHLWLRARGTQACSIQFEHLALQS